MFRNWRIDSVNGALLAAYFIPAWTLVAFNIMVAPVHGLYERPSVAVALFLSDHLQMAGMDTVRAAWLLALGRLTVVAFFAIYLALLCIPRVRRNGGRDGGAGTGPADRRLSYVGRQGIGSQGGGRERRPH